MYRNILLLLFLFSCSKDQVKTLTSTIPPNPLSASTVIDSMGTGFNLGNTFDYKLNNTSPESIYPIIDLYYNAGMRHIRIPITWMDGFEGNTLADSLGNINTNHPRFVQLKSVVDYAIAKKMYVVINTHHEHWLYKNYDGSSKYNTIFTTLWKGIATQFKDYPQRLVFEVLNEPQGVFGDWSGGALPSNANALSFTRQINQVGYNAIRNTGGINNYRILMISTNGMGNHNQLDDVYPSIDSVPGKGSDKFLSFQVHTYDPWSFCGQTGSNASWPGSNTISNGLINVANHARKLNIPVNYGEFGVGRSANAAERNTDTIRTYYRTMRLTCLQEHMAPTVWDDRGWFGLVNQNGSEFIYNIVPSMMAE